LVQATRAALPPVLPLRLPGRDDAPSHGVPEHGPDHVGADEPSEEPPEEPINVELRYVYALDEHTPLDGAVISRVIWHQRVSIGRTPRCDERRAL
jgi:hypothetical protein